MLEVKSGFLEVKRKCFIGAQACFWQSKTSASDCDYDHALPQNKLVRRITRIYTRFLLGQTKIAINLNRDSIAGRSFNLGNPVSK